MKLVFAAAILFTSLPCLSCTLGVGETTLTLQRVMRNFGRSLVSADTAVLRGSQSPRAVRDNDLTLAIAGLDEAISCANAVLDDPSGALLPSKLNQLAEADRPAYLKKFLDDMSHFRSGLVEYRNIFRELVKTPLADRKYTDARSKSQDVLERARAAHADLG